MSKITVETCGKSYCEHYPEGLFTCAKCREASTLAHDKACAKIAEAQADADHWKGECNSLQRMVHEARAEIERKDKNLQIIAALANNALYFDDSSDYKSALWNILVAAKPELFAESDMPKLKFMPGNAAEEVTK